MEPEKAEIIQKDIEALRRDIELWRNTREKQGPMQEDLWQQATELARKYGVTKVAQILRLHHTKLKNRLGAHQEPRQGGVFVSKPATFVELEPVTVPEATEQRPLVVALCGADGSQMTLHLPARQMLDVPGLVETFFRRSP